MQKLFCLQKLSFPWKNISRKHLLSSQVNAFPLFTYIQPKTYLHRGIQRDLLKLSWLEEYPFSLYKITCSHTCKIFNSCTADWKTRERSGNDTKNSWQGLRNTVPFQPQHGFEMSTLKIPTKPEPRQETRGQPRETLKWADSSQDCAGNHQSREVCSPVCSTCLKWMQHYSPLPYVPKEKGRE